MPLGMVVSHMLNSNYIITPLRFIQGIGPWSIWLKTSDVTVGACTLTVPNFGNSAVFVEVVSGVMNQNNIRGVRVE